MAAPVISFLSGFLPQPVKTGLAAGEAVAGLFAALLGGETAQATPQTSFAAALPTLAPGAAEPALDGLSALLDRLGALLDDKDAIPNTLEEFVDGLAALLDLPPLAETARAALAGFAAELQAAASPATAPPGGATPGTDAPARLADALTRLAGQLSALAPEQADALEKLGARIAAAARPNAAPDPDLSALLTKLGADHKSAPAPAPTPPAPTFEAARLQSPAPEGDGDKLAAPPRADLASARSAPPAREAEPLLPPGAAATAAPPTAPPPAIAPPDPVALAAPARLQPYVPALAQLAVPQLAFEIARQAQGGNERFQIRLDPPELGRIDVKLDFDAGTVHARLSVERAETLDLLQRDQRTLERALAQAGLDSQRTSLEFSLRQNPSGRDDRGGFVPAEPAFGARADSAPEPVVTLYRGTATPGGVDLIA